MHLLLELRIVFCSVQVKGVGASESSSDAQTESMQDISVMETTATTAVSDAETVSTDWSDISCWPQKLTDGERSHLVEMGPIRVTDVQFPTNDTGRHFSPYYYNRKLANGETVPRGWMVYSQQCDAVFCFCCRLFGSGSNNFVTGGCRNW